MHRRRRLSTESPSSLELLSGAAAGSAREEAGLAFLGVGVSLEAGFLRLGGKCRAGGVRNRDSGSPAALAEQRGVVAVAHGVWDVCRREEVPGAVLGGKSGPWGSSWLRPHGGHSPPAAYDAGEWRR